MKDSVNSWKREESADQESAAGTHKAVVCQVVADVNRDCLVDGTLIQDKAISRWIHYGSSTANGTCAIWGRHKMKYHRKYL